MQKSFLLENKLYHLLYEKLLVIDSITEKVIHIHLSNIIHFDFGVKRVFNEASYRYCVERGNGKYYSDKDSLYCAKIQSKRPRKCDIRLLEPPSWIELKLNPNKSSLCKDIQKLFIDNSSTFTRNENLFSLNFFLKKNLDSVKDHERVIIKTFEDLDIHSKLIPLSQNDCVLILHKSGKDA